MRSCAPPMRAPVDVDREVDSFQRGWEHDVEDDEVGARGLGFVKCAAASSAVTTSKPAKRREGASTLEAEHVMETLNEDLAADEELRAAYARARRRRSRSR